MRAAVLFVLSLCFLLLNVPGDVHADTHHSNTYDSASQHIEKTLLTKFGNANQSFAVIKNDSFGEKKEDFVSVEDEDDDIVFTRKYIPLAKYFITLAHESVLISCYNYSKNRLPLCRHLSYTSSYKYILQRVLRL